MERVSAFKNIASVFGLNVTVFDPADKDGFEVGMVNRMLESKRQVDGVFICGNTSEFMNFYHGFVERGVRPGEDVNVVTCINDLEIIPKLNVRVANIDIQAEQLGQRAVEKLLWRMKNPTKPRERIFVEPRIVCNESGSKVRSCLLNRRIASDFFW